MNLGFSASTLALRISRAICRCLDPGGVDRCELEPLLPKLAAPGLLEVLPGLFGIVGVLGVLRILGGEPDQHDAVRLDRGPEEHLLDEGVPVEAVLERLSHVDVGEEVRRDAVRTEGAVADIAAVRRDALDEVDLHQPRRREVLHDLDSRSSLELAQVGHLRGDDVGVAGLEQQDRGLVVRNELPDDPLQLRRALPVVLEAFEDEALRRVPGHELERPGAHHLAEQGVFFHLPVHELLAGLPGARPVALGNAPVLVEDRGHVATVRHDGEERHKRPGKLEGHRVARDGDHRVEHVEGLVIAHLLDQLVEGPSPEKVGAEHLDRGALSRRRGSPA